MTQPLIMDPKNYCRDLVETGFLESGEQNVNESKELISDLEASEKLNMKIIQIVSYLTINGDSPCGPSATRCRSQAPLSNVRPAIVEERVLGVLGLHA